MKLFAITLALAVFIGSCDSDLSAEPVSKLEQLMRNIQEYVSDISGDIEELAAVVGESDLAQEMKDYTAENYSNISRRLQKIEADLPSEVKRTLQLVFSIPPRVAIEVFSGFSKLTDRLKFALEEVYETLEPVVSPYAKPVVGQVRTYADALRTGIKELNKNQKDKLKLQVEEMGPYVKNVQNQVREFQVALQPMTDKVQERFKENMESATNSLKPYMGPVLEKLGEYHPHFKNWVMNLISPLFT
ncbi:uncharacterized protein LOC129343377 [Eublepharis macularius]|uniref:Uncharacterized protein LOC129343377 n=1 Tax=Eublepharis macularius TaxID=481883 RepID=A0AA97KIM0_EUBMA|nr:uncharacterized protein LOC129343377 [Eublepharis macularius]XP_054855534.1 uncharacterized protein LOC129343377 [Eublepharis macularius]